MSETKLALGELRVSAFEVLSGGSARMLMADDNFSIAYVGERSEAENDAIATRIVRSWNCHDELVAALRRAEQFISNGIELGFIRMPDASTPDPAHDTPRIIRAAISKASGEA